MSEFINKIIEEFYKSDQVIAVALGGSRARGRTTQYSDYDLFVVLSDEAFNGIFYDEIDERLVKNGIFLISGYMHYNENWGYIHKGIDKNGVHYDISYISLSRIDEMGIKSTNKLFFDKNGIYAAKMKEAHDDIDQQYEIALKNRSTIISRLVFDILDYKKSVKKNQYWEKVKYIDRIRRNVMLLKRIQVKKLGKHYFSPEKNYEEDTQDFIFKQNYNLGGEVKIEETFDFLMMRFYSLISLEEKTKIEFILHMKD